jgi:hypothetical protein
MDNPGVVIAKRCLPVAFKLSELLSSMELEMNTQMKPMLIRS